MTTVHLFSDSVVPHIVQYDVCPVGSIVSSGCILCLITKALN